jgi:hypothetical protein
MEPATPSNVGVDTARSCGVGVAPLGSCLDRDSNGCTVLLENGPEPSGGKSRTPFCFPSTHPSVSPSVHPCVRPSVRLPPARPSVWKSGNQETHTSGHRKIQKSGNLDIWKLGPLPSPPNKKKTETESTRAGLVREINNLTMLHTISIMFSMGQKHRKKNTRLFAYLPW